MFFEEVTLFRCKRIAPGEHELLRIKPSSKIQLVLGSNGSGKSSLLEVGFSVMPASSNHFHKGGYKEVVVSHRDGRYCLRTDYKGTAHHSFIDLHTGEELNKGGTLGVQKDLILDIFGMTQEIHDLLIGKVRFTQMPPSKRQEWITKMSDADFSYILKFYADICKNERANKNVLKHQTERLSNSVTNLLPTVEIERLRARARQISNELNVLLSERDLYSESAKVVQDRLTLQVSSFIRDSEAFIFESNRMSVPMFSGGKAIQINDIIDVKANLQAKLSQLDGSARELAVEHEHLERKLAEIRELENVDVNELHERLSKIDTGLAELTNRFAAFEYFKEPLNCRGKTYLRDEIQVFGQLLANVESGGDPDLYNAAKNDHAITQQQLSDMSGTLKDYERELEHILKCEQVSCPNCATEFKPGVAADRPVYLRAAAASLSTRIQDLEKLQVSRKEIIQVWEARQQYDAGIRSFMSNHWDLNDLWTVVSRFDFGQKLQILSVCKEFEQALNATKQHYQLLDNKIPVEVAIEKSKARESVSGVKERYDYVVQRLQEVSGASRGRLTNAIDKINRWDQHTERCMATYDDLNARVHSIVHDLNKLEDAVRQSCIGEVITQHQTDLSDINSTLSRVDVQQALVNDLQGEVSQLESQSDAYAHIRKILSPEDGLIARQISLHIGRIINRMNRVIAKIWGYPMTILPCENEDESLNYRFPVRIKDTDDMIEDIQYGSRSQVDVIDEAFRIVAYKSLGIEAGPLYLDEFGSSFDTLHRNNLVAMLDELFEDPQFGQIFMISHYMEGYEGVSTAQVIVLNDANVTVTRSYNEHVEFG